MDKLRFKSILLILTLILFGLATQWFNNNAFVSASEKFDISEDEFDYLPLAVKSNEEQIPTQTPAPTPTPIPTLPPIGDAIIIDHTSIELFDQIPPHYLEIARNTPMIFSDRSVGGNIDAYLNCLASGNIN